jgi:hypothetical protein
MINDAAALRQRSGRKKMKMKKFKDLVTEYKKMESLGYVEDIDEQNKITQLVKDFISSFTEVREMPYGEYKDKYIWYKTIADTYNPETKTISVLVPKSFTKELEEMGLNQEVELWGTTKKARDWLEEFLTGLNLRPVKFIEKIADSLGLPRYLLVTLYQEVYNSKRWGTAKQW